MKTIYHINICTLEAHITENSSGVSFMLSSLKTAITIVLLFILMFLSEFGFAQAASSNYDTQTGTLGTTYSWIDCSSGSSIVTGDDAQASISWPFNFAFYDNEYTTSNSLSVCTNGFIRLDGVASTDYSTASSFDLTATATELGQIIALAVYDDKVGDNSGWVNYLVTGSSPNRVFTIEYYNLEIDYNDGLYTSVQVSFYETSYKVVLKLGADNIATSGVDMGIQSGVENYFNKWQEVLSGTNNAWIEYTPSSTPTPPSDPAASWNYGYNSGTLGTTYSWIDCSSGSFVVSGDDAQAQISWPFEFNYYDNTFTTSNSLSVCTNGFIRLDGEASTDYSAASAYDLTSTATDFGQIIALAVYDDNVDGTSWVRSLVTGSAPDRIFTVEYNNLEIDYNDGLYATAQVSFYESINKVVLKLGADNINKSGVDMGLHSGVDTFFNKWQEVLSGTNNAWIEYLPPYVEVSATNGTAVAYYATVSEAFAKINDGTHQGGITIKINNSTTESESAELNASGTGSANYSSVNIYPTEAGLSITGELTLPLIDLNGADNVTIDGRVNATGTTVDLSIINTNSGSASGTSAIRFINGATNNTVKYCTVKSSESRSTSGIIFFSTTTSSSGNNNNTIENNNITTAADASRPVNAIYSLGTSGKDNSENTIQNNNIYDFLKHASASNGIFLSSNSTAWTIDGNSFYETAPFTPSGTVTYIPIKIDNVSGNGFTLSNNYFGGREPECGGTAWTKTNAANNVFYAIYLEVGTTTASSIQNNTIQNINWSNSGIATWAGIYVEAGSVNIGTETGNIIGATTGTGSITVTGGTNGQSIYGIKMASTGVINCFNNSIGSITGLTTSTFSTHIYGIDLSGSSVADIKNNTIGSTTTANSIYASSASTANVQKVYGIYTRSSGTTDIHENRISNVRNNTSNTAVGTLGFINGLYLTAGINTVHENTISDLSIANANTSTYTPSVAGIHLNTTTEVQSIHENLIYNISNTSSSFTGCVVGIFTRNLVGASDGSINANFIHSLSVASASTGAKIYGIYENTDGIVYSNNIITLGGTTSTEMYGIYDVGNSGKTGSFYFNTVYISGTDSGSENSYALRYNTNSNTRDLRDNILSNARSGGSGSHYAIYYDATGGTFTGDYNDYYASGTGGILGYYGGDKNTLALLQSATSQDANSLNIDPIFILAGGTDADDYVTLASLPGIAITGITTTYHGITRNDPPKMGALEVSPIFTWQGTTSTDFATATNWADGAVPPNGADILFADTPSRDCYLDQNRTVNNITNTSSKKLVINAKELTITGSIVSATANQIDASSASSEVIFAGNAVQTIPNGAFVSSTVDALTVNNIHGLTQNGNLLLSTAFTLTDGNFAIGENTLTINGAIITTSGTLTGGSASNITIGGSGAATTLPGVTLNNLILNRANGIDLGGSVDVGGILALTAGTLTVGANTLTISGDAPTRVSGNIDVSNASATLELTNSTNITCPESIFVGSINNFTINGAGLTSCCSCTINGVLNLQSANPSGIKGTLDMGSDTLTMGVNATTIGTGDVTGIVRRAHTFTANNEYSFGSQFTTFTFVDANTKPTWICVKISIGTVPGWDPWSPDPNGKVKRLYQVSSSDNSSTSQANINMRYLLSELDPTYNNESKLIFWHKYTLYDGGLPHEHGKANQSFTNHFIGVVGLTFGSSATTDLDDSQVAIAYSVQTKNTWKGEVAGHETEWEQTQNWTAGTVPVSTEDVLIPEGLTYYPSLTASANAVAQSIEIEIGASITANAYDITVSGSGGAWNNQGTFYSGTGKVIFDHGVSTEIVTVAGITNFYDVEIGANTTLEPVSGCVFRIAGAASGDPSTSRANWAVENSTVEWNGTNQTINNPVGLGGSGYYNLILSGSGTKTMPATDMNIVGDFTLEGTATATAASALTIGGNYKIEENATFATGAYSHTIGGNFDNDGTFTASSGTSISLVGIALQSILGSSATSFEALTIDNPAGVNIYTDVTVNDELTLTDGNLNALATELTISGDVSKTSGYINTSNLSSLSFGGTTALTLASNVFYSTPSIDTLTINRTGGVIFGSDLTVNGELNLEGANPASGTIGSLDMGTYTLSMGTTATTNGVGDVTGIVKRTTILPNTEYTFGNQYTSATFPNVGTLPTEIALKISIGTAPSWKSDAVKRFYELIHVGGSGTRAVLKGHYLDSELNGNTENDLIDISYVIPLTTLIERGRSDINTTENWVSLSNLDFSLVPTSFGVMELSFGVSTTDVITWDGSVSTDWDEATNWTPAFSPDATKNVVIPDATTTPNDPLLPASDSIYTLSIHTGGILNSGASSELTVVGAGGAWVNSGTFNASTGKVIFKHDGDTEIVTIAGETDFYTIEAGENTTMQPVSGAVLRIAGSGIAYASSVVDFLNVDNTVEWNGAAQTIAFPNGIAGNSGFYNLILSGSGTKTMPSSALTIRGDFSTSGTVSATAADAISVYGNTTIGNGTTFATGSYHHALQGDFENNGTFTPTSGGSITFNGTSTQTISGSSSISFYDLSVSNLQGVSMSADVDVNNELSFYNGELSVGANTLGINGTIFNPSGNIDLSSTSSLSFGGTAAITLNNNLFSGGPTINNLTIKRSGGVTLGNENITVNGTVILTSGTLTIAANTLTIAGNTPTRTAGNIDASNASATLECTNSSAITLPASLFSGNVNNLTINGGGGVIAGGDFTLDGVLNLESANPSSTKGSLDMSTYTLTMGGSSTTIGQGDVIGIIKRTSITYNTIYTMGNQYTTIYFSNVGTLPTQMSIKVAIGTVPSWRTGAVKRAYDFIQTGGSGTEARVQGHYLDSELNGNEESKLVDWMHIYATPLTLEYGRSDYNTNENWVTVSHVNVNVFASVFGNVGVGFDEYEALNLTWNGSTNTSWVTATNWTPQGAPSDETVVTIPDAATTPNDPYIPETGICGKVVIESGGILKSVNDGQLTVKGSTGAWDNSGTFAPGTGTVIFANGDETETMTISGTSSFYNLKVSDKTKIQPATDAVINIGGVFTANPNNCILDFSSNPNTVAYEGGKVQNVVNPGGSYGYYHLSFRDDGLIILPESSLKISGDLSINASVSATGNTILMAGIAAQTISGDTASILNNVTIDNTTGVTLTNTALTTISGSLLINSGKKFEIAAAQKLSVTGTITNSAGTSGFILNSDATGTASLYHTSDNVAATVERYISGTAEDWHFISAPVADQEISGSWLPSGTYGNGTGYDLYLWNESNSCWIYKLNTTSTINWNTVHPSSNFEAGRGYLYSVEESLPTKEFIGNLNNGSITTSLSYASETSTLKGFVLIGNPYASSIDWKASSGWTRTDLESSSGGYNMWIWNQDANNYGVYNSADMDDVGTNSIGRYIASTQGFFVQASTSGDLTMANDVRVLESTNNWFKRELMDESKVSVCVKSDANYGFDEVRLNFGYYENEKGAQKLFSKVSNAPSLYVPYSADSLSVMNLTNTDENPNVPISFIAGASGDYTINCNFDLDRFDVVMLEDCKTHSIQNMKANASYSFSAEKSDSKERFKLHFGAVDGDFGEELPARVYSDGSHLIVDLSLVTNETTVSVYDIMGRLLLQGEYSGETLHKIPLYTNTQILIVHLKNPSGTLSKKVFLNSNR